MKTFRHTSATSCPSFTSEPRKDVVDNMHDGDATLIFIESEQGVLQTQKDLDFYK